MRQVRGAALGAALAFPLLVVFGGLFTSADSVFGTVVASAFDVDFGDLLSHVVLFAVWGALVAGYFRGAVIRLLVPGSEGESGRWFGVITVPTARVLVDGRMLLFVVVRCPAAAPVPPPPPALPTARAGLPAPPLHPPARPRRRDRPHPPAAPAGGTPIRRLLRGVAQRRRCAAPAPGPPPTRPIRALRGRCWPAEATCPARAR